MSAAGGWALMLVSVVLAVAGISVAWRVLRDEPDISARLAREWSGAHRTLTRKCLRRRTV